MTDAPTESRSWRHGRFWAIVALVLGLQVALIEWMGDRSSLVRRLPLPAPVVRLGDTSAGEPLPMQDPTLFVLPHRESFSGSAWMKTPVPEFHLEDRSAPPRWLTLSQDQLGTEFEDFARTTAPPRFDDAVKMEPVFSVPVVPSIVPMATRSTLQIEGRLARRRLRSPVELPSWPGATPLTNSEVQVLVDAPGSVVYAVLFSGSGSDAADNSALQLARAARFEPVGTSGPDHARKTMSELTVGRLIFEWQTLPATNGPAPPPP